MKKLILFLSLVISLLATLVTAQNTLERALEQGYVLVGFANESPYAFAQPDGTLTGEAVEVARVVFERMGVGEVVGVLTEFGSLIPGLQAGRFDVITAGMFINPTRCEQVAFADPEYSIGEGLIVKSGNPLNLHSYEDIAANLEVKVGTGAGFLEFNYMLDIGVAENQIVTFPDGQTGIAGLQSNRIDAFTATGPALEDLLSKANDSNLELADPFTDPVIDGESVRGYGGAAFRLADTDFRDAFNVELQALKDSGELAEIIGEFGFGEQSLPGEVTSVGLCAQ